MMTLQQIRQDLRDIRYYYSKKELFDSMIDVVLPNAIVDKIMRYNKAMERAPVRLLDIYISLYLNNRTQVSLAEERNYSAEYIKQINLQLCQYLQKTFAEGSA